MTDNMSKTDRLIFAITSSLNDISPHKVTPEILALGGMSGARYKRFVNRLLSHDVVNRYLEIGVWKGSTAIAALHGNHERLSYTVIDNYSQTFPGEGVNGPKKEFLDNWKKCIGGTPNLIEEDCFAFSPQEKGIRDIDVYFYDGEHSETNQYNALKHYYSAMADSFVFMVDDWSWPHVQRGTYAALHELKPKIAFKIDQYGTEDSGGWWNGCGIFVLEK